jgi:hypothetical protein
MVEARAGEVLHMIDGIPFRRQQQWPTLCKYLPDLRLANSDYFDGDSLLTNGAEDAKAIYRQPDRLLLLLKIICSSLWGISMAIRRTLSFSDLSCVECLTAM